MLYNLIFLVSTYLGGGLAHVLGYQFRTTSQLQHKYVFLNVKYKSVCVRVRMCVYIYIYFVICGEVYQICCIIIEFISTNFKKHIC